MKQRIIYILISLVLPALQSSAQTIDEARAFADSLYQAGNRELALPVYQRVLFFHPSPVDPEILFRVAECFLFTGEIDQALEYYDHSYFAQTSDSLRNEILFRKASCYITNHHFPYAQMELLNLGDSLSRFFEQKCNIYLGITWFGLSDFEKSESCFILAVHNPSTKAKIHNLFSNTKLLYHPNPKTASWLSVCLPGSGQIYSGEIGSGINSLLLTGSFIGLGIYIAKTYAPIDAIFSALPWFQRYYQGGFQRAADLATMKRTKNRSRMFNEVLTLIAQEQ